jgi:hypothetical protein
MEPSNRSKIVIVRLHSGIGNQLFQYNFLNYLKGKYNIRKVYFDLRSYYPGIFDKLLKNQYFFKLNTKYQINLYLDRIIKLRKLNSLIAGIISKVRKFNSGRNSLKFLPVTLTDKNYMDYSFISENRVLFLSGVFLDRNLIQNETIDALRRVRNDLMKGKTNNYNFESSVSIHIRGGSVLELQINRDYIQPMPIGYYKEALKIINSKARVSNYFIFSNDEILAKSKCTELQLDNYHIINREDYNDLEALFLMSYCNHNIIANSSYSFWAAVINDKLDKIVISPEYFLKPHHSLYQIVQQLPYDDWIKIDNRSGI